MAGCPPVGSKPECRVVVKRVRPKLVATLWCLAVAGGVALRLDSRHTEKIDEGVATRLFSLCARL